MPLPIVSRPLVEDVLVSLRDKSGRADIRGRAGEYVRASETAAMHDASVVATNLFRGAFEIRPRHNPVGPFDFAGAYDEPSDRPHGVGELVDRGYQDE